MAERRRPVRAVTVYCGSSGRADADLLGLAGETGRAIASRGWGVVYGGASVGMMGQVADQALAAGGRVTGVITRQLVDFEVAHPGLTELRVVESMHERKRVMSDLGDGFLVLPGGFGTLDELFEAVSWRQLGLHDKPIVLLNHEGFFDRLNEFIGLASARGLIRPPHLGLLTSVDGVGPALDAIESPPARPDAGDRWWEAGREPPPP